MEPSKLPLPFSRVGNHQLFTTQCDRSCPPASLMTLSSLSHLYTAIIIRRLPNHITSILLYLLSHLSATSLLLVSQSPRISAAVYTVHIYPPSLSASVSDSVVLNKLRSPFLYYLPRSKTSQISASYISSASLPSLSPSSRASYYETLSSCSPVTSLSTVAPARLNQ